MKNIAIGFVTGRKQFNVVLNTYINNWLEHGLIQDKNIRLHLFIAYDLKYQNTSKDDFKNVSKMLGHQIDSINFWGDEDIANEQMYIREKYGLTAKEVSLLFGDGYAKRRNIITYAALKNDMDALIFIDDDEYPLAIAKNQMKRTYWQGQSVVGTHLKFLEKAHITHGRHCGYISPIPYLEFNEILTESDFKDFIDAISNDIISWEKVKHTTVFNKGVTYADSNIIDHVITYEVPQEKGMKFISGANLGFNLRADDPLPPFYNPPGARGEDTFMSTALSQLIVLKLPCYTFHDGFGEYKNLLTGVLPLNLNGVSLSEKNLKRFIKAVVGWVRYKPLMVYITQPKNFESLMNIMQSKLELTIPKLNKYFNTKEFDKVLKEFHSFRNNAPTHYFEFQETKEAWFKLYDMLKNKQRVTPFALKYLTVY